MYVYFYFNIHHKKSKEEKAQNKGSILQRHNSLSDNIIFFYILLATNHIHKKSTSPKLLEMYHIFTFGVGNGGFTVSNSIWLGHWHVLH